MHVIINAANLDWSYTVTLGNAADICPYPLFDLGANERLPILCAKYEMQIYLRICVCHFLGVC